MPSGEHTLASNGRLGYGNEEAGWKAYNQKKQFSSDNKGIIWIAFGISVVWETHLAYWIDDLSLNLDKVNNLAKISSFPIFIIVFSLIYTMFVITVMNYSKLDQKNSKDKNREELQYPEILEDF